jgi:hypothetical protein
MRSAASVQWAAGERQPEGDDRQGVVPLRPLGRGQAHRRLRQGKKAAFPDEKAVGGDAQGGVVMEAAPAAAFNAAKAQFLLELLPAPRDRDRVGTPLHGALDSSAQGGDGDEILQAGLGRQAGDPEALHRPSDPRSMSSQPSGSATPCGAARTRKAV